MDISNSYQPDTAIVGLWFRLNYGSILSAYALYKTVEDMGYSPVFVNQPTGLWTEKLDDPENIAGKFIHSRCYVSPKFYDEKTRSQFTDQRKNFIVGSDAVWNYDICGKKTGGFFFLDFVPDDKNKIAYASSFGGEFRASAMAKVQTQELLQRIPHRAVGDIAALETINLDFGLGADYVLDPLFLWNRYDFQVGNPIKKPYVFVYFQDCGAQKRKMINLAVETRKCPSVHFADIDEYGRSSTRYQLQVEPQVSVEEWAAALREADYVLTDSYSAMCLAIQLEKPFLVLASKTSGDLRRYTYLLEILGLQERMVYVEEDMREFTYLLKKPINYPFVNKKLEQHRAASREWLLKSLQSGGEV